MPTDPERTPEGMKQQLLDLETAYVLRLDTVASLKRRIAMLEESLDPAISKHLF
ncbi:Putative serine/threonine-protein kinase C1D4.11C [Giardia duodenalis]|uniref:Putative serine/threonine-protein kinase C1D4.11C n=1 Tax=Giardia intestinalis TaxID=5741 RepID=V6U1K6_GIAIN|nr:Putative serine/threonine-protein kinase C1D4.11C [Giardia intestinalis]